mgnify:CR=1 FL=1
MEKPFIPSDLDELKDFIERNNLTAEFKKFILEVDAPISQDFTITLKLKCTPRDSK